MWHAHDGMGWWMIFGGVFWILILASFIWLVVSVMRPSQRGGGHETHDAHEIARRRYAAGEISREEFERIRDDLHAARSP